MAKKYKGKFDLAAVHLWREDLPEEIKAVFKIYDDVFPKDLPPELPPICKGGMNSRLSWKMIRPQCTGHCTN